MTEAPAPARRDARASGLRYVSPDAPGIRRRKAGRGFTYENARGRTVRDEKTLARIRSLVIPPAWTDVWICPDPDGHLQAVGRDARGRRQYRYHPRFRARRDRGKFARLVRFGERLPRIRRRVREDLKRPGLPREKVLATVVALLETTRFRVGNAEYARLNRSFGISTLRTRHASVSGATVRFRFRGKGGRVEEGALVDRRLATIVRRCQDLPGQELFQYEGEDGEARPISSEDVNDYLREAAGSDEFSAKDFRTWTATVLAHRALRDALDGHDAAAAAAAAEDGTAGGGADTRADATRGLPKRVVAAAIEQVAEALGDTIAVTRSAYVHPAVLEAAPEAQGGRRRRRGEGPTRHDELAVLAVLRATTPAAGARSSRGRGARSSQVGAGSLRGRSRRRSA